MHHGGQFRVEGNYIGAEVAYYDYCDINKMSKIELDDMAKELGYTGHSRFYFKGNCL